MSQPAASILIVDDEPQNRKLLETLLRPEGYLTQCAANGEAALIAIQQHMPDLILLDVMMPGMDGYQVAEAVKANPCTSHIPIIMVTALIERGARLRGLNSGAEEFLTKPIDRAELWLRVRNLLRLKAYSDFLQNHSAILEQEVQARTARLQQFRSAMDATADAILLASRSALRFVEVNATACDMFGYSRDELMQLGPIELAEATHTAAAELLDFMVSGAETTEFREVVLRRKDGSEFKVEMSRTAHRTGDDWLIVGVLRDVTERDAAQQRLHQLAHYDTLTGLPNRTLFYQTLESSLALAADSAIRVAVMCVDLDQFKNLNDTLGHALGDELLRQFSTRLVKCVRVRDSIGRLGGDEFALIVEMRDGQDCATQVASQIRDFLRTPFDLKGHQFAVTASIGISLFPDDASNSDELMKYADTAMYRAKRAGRDTFRFFTAQMNDEILARLELETALRNALENKEFTLHYQPKVRLDNGRIAGLEALLRWQRPGVGLVLPKQFIPVLEETGLIVRVGAWVISEVCEQIGRWARASIEPVSVSVNVSDRQFLEGDLESLVTRSILANGISPELLELELTEGSMITNTERTISCLKVLKSQGVQISIDDFGTGYSSLAYLRRFPIDTLKIDIAFIRDITSNPDAATIVRAIMQMAHSLKLEVVAEGVETEAQLAVLRSQGCDYIQGYYYSRPLAMPEIETLLREDRRLPMPVGQPASPPKTLLLVDDEALTLAAIQLALHQEGYHILTAQSAAQGFELLALNEVHVILCDQRMPNMNGTEFLNRVMELYPDTLRIVLSGYIEIETILRAINCGAIYRFYTKPLDNRILRNNIREAFRHHGLLRARAGAQPTDLRQSEGVTTH